MKQRLKKSAGARLDSPTKTPECRPLLQPARCFSGPGRNPVRCARGGRAPDTLSSWREAAYTLTEMMVGSALFALIILGILACHFAGLRFYQFIQPKLQNAQYSRQTVSRIIEEIRCANSVQVGTGTLSSFTVAGPTNYQAGNALRIYLSTNSTQFIYYFHDPASSTVQKIPLGGTNAEVIATAVTNDAIFTMEDFAGNVLTNSQNNAVTGVFLQMMRNSTWNGISDEQQVRTKITRRNIL